MLRQLSWQDRKKPKKVWRKEVIQSKVLQKKQQDNAWMEKKKLVTFIAGVAYATYGIQSKTEFKLL